MFYRRNKIKSKRSPEPPNKFLCSSLAVWETNGRKAFNFTTARTSNTDKYQLVSSESKPDTTNAILNNQLIIRKITIESKFLKHQGNKDFSLLKLCHHNVEDNGHQYYYIIYITTYILHICCMLYNSVVNLLCWCSTRRTGFNICNIYSFCLPLHFFVSIS